MIKTENDIIFNRIKNTVGFHKSKKFKKWFHEVFEGAEQHHGCGSYSGIKTSDYFSVPLTHQEHLEAEKNKSDFCVNNIEKFINVMQRYIIHLEGKK